jgi:hypothetical protein
MTRERPKPTLEVTLGEAVEDLTGIEVDTLERRYSKGLENWTAKQLLVGVVWSYENRTVKTEWADVNARTMRELDGYFVQTEDLDKSGDESGSGEEFR